MRLLFILVLAFMFTNTSIASDYGAISIVPDGGAAGGDALYIPKGDILNVRNIQGGVIGDPNLDLGAGSEATPGNLVLQYDVGHKTIIYDGRKRLVAVFGPNRIVFYGKVTFKQRPRYDVGR